MVVLEKRTKREKRGAAMQCTLVQKITYDNCEVTYVDWGYKPYLCDPDKDIDKDTKKNLHCKRQCGGKEYRLNTIKKENGDDNEPLHPFGNSFMNNTIMADDEEKSPAVLKCSEKTKILNNNVFQKNKLFKAKAGDLPKDTCEVLSSKPKITKPKAGPEDLP
jgi:hypothetical protein